MTDFIYNFSLKIFELMQGFLTFCWNLISSGSLRFIAKNFILITILMCIVCTCIDEWFYYKRTGKHNIIIVLMLSAWKLILTGIYKCLELLEEKGIELPFFQEADEPKTIEQVKRRNEDPKEDRTVIYEEPKPIAEASSDKGYMRSDGAYIVRNPQNIRIPANGGLEKISDQPKQDESVVNKDA